MAEADIPVDLFNPGQVFACLGFLEAADILLGDAEGGFDWSNEDDVRFRLRANGEGNPFEAVLDFFLGAEVSTFVPAGSRIGTEKWNVTTIVLGVGKPFPFPEPKSPATLPVSLRDRENRTIIIDHWGDATKRDAVKFWAGSGGYPGGALVRDGLESARKNLLDASTNPFSHSSPQSSSFRFDCRRDYIPLDVGFSPNTHGNMTMIGYPLVEILAAIGLSNARPERLDKLNYRYCVLGTALGEIFYDPIFFRIALGGSLLPFPQRLFRIRLGWPGQENQARCIIDSFEEVLS